jgi:predicted membrane protein
VLQHLIFTICAEFGKFLIFHVLNYSCYRRRKFLIYHQLESANSTFMKVSMMRPRTLLRLTVCNFYSFLFIYVLSSTSSSKKKKILAEDRIRRAGTKFCLSFQRCSHQRNNLPLPPWFATAKVEALSNASFPWACLWWLINIWEKYLGSCK